MNRAILNRQMFAGGGAAFPDLSGDGKVTQKDILMGRGVVPMAGGGNVQYYEEGGGTTDPEALVRRIIGSALQARGSNSFSNLGRESVESLIEQAVGLGGLAAG